MSQLDDVLKEGLVALKEPMGDAATYTPVSGAPVAVTILLSDVKPLETSVPGYITQCDVYLDELVAAPARGDAVTVGSVEYSVIEVVSDPGVGLAKLTLRKK